MNNNTSNSKKDEVFAKAIAEQFSFNDDVAAVFDDMLARSVPFYSEMLHLSCNIALKFLVPNSKVYDLGCSTATTLLHLEQQTAMPLQLIGIDNAAAMVAQAKKKITALGSKVAITQGDFLEFSYEKATLFLANYTLQFIRPIERERLLQKIFNALEDDGVFIFSEKVISTHKRLNFEMIEHYYQFKRDNGYSQYEIAQKREALENVLVPYSEEENIIMAKRAGFAHCEVLFRWNNFALFIALKS